MKVQKIKKPKHRFSEHSSAGFFNNEVSYNKANMYLMMLIGIGHKTPKFIDQVLVSPTKITTTIGAEYVMKFNSDMRKLGIGTNHSWHMMKNKILHRYGLLHDPRAEHEGRIHSLPPADYLFVTERVNSFMRKQSRLEWRLKRLRRLHESTEGVIPEISSKRLPARIKKILEEELAFNSYYRISEF